MKKTCTLRDFVEKTHQLVPYNPRRFFFEFVSAKEEITDDKEIILMERVSEKHIYYDWEKCMAFHNMHDMLGYKKLVHWFESQGDDWSISQRSQKTISRQVQGLCSEWWWRC